MSQAKADSLVKTLTDKINAKSDAAKGFGEAIILNFTDAPEAYWIKLAMDGKVEKVEKAPNMDLQKKGAKATLTTTTNIIDDVLSGKRSNQASILGGQIQISGSISALMKIAPAFA